MADDPVLALQQAFARLNTTDDKVNRCWKLFSVEERQSQLAEAVKSFKQARGSQASKPADEKAFEEAVLRDFRTRFSKLKTEDDGRMFQSLLRLGRGPGGEEEVKAVFTQLWPVFQKAQGKALDVEEDGDEGEEEDYIGLFQTLVTSFAGILGLMLTKRAASLCDGPECIKAESSSETSTETFKKCGQCLKVRYCSRECQVAAWKQGHKLACQKTDPSTTAA